MTPRWVWFDLDNTPHVLFLEPLARRLRTGGWDVRVTARPQAQTLELAELRGLPATAVGSGDFVTLASKLAGAMSRAIKLARWVRAQRGTPSLLVSCSRSASLAAWMLRIPAVALLDYEHAEQRLLALAASAIWFPEVLRHVQLPRSSQRLARFYPGLKENLYLDTWALDREDARAAANVDPSDILVVARPPAETAFYARVASTNLWVRAVDGLARRARHKVIVIARTGEQHARIRAVFAGRRAVRFCDRAVDGPALVNAADLVLGGGGTMNREAAVLGVPVWSVFTGPAPRVDDVLASEGRLRWVRSDAELERALADPLPGRRRRRGPVPEGVNLIVDDLESRLSASQLEGLAS